MKKKLKNRTRGESKNFIKQKALQLEKQHGLSTYKREISDEEKATNKHLAISGTALAMAIAGTVLYPPLRLLSGIIALYAILPVFKNAKYAIFKERRVSIFILDSIAVTVGLIYCNFIAMAISITFYHAAKKLHLKTKDKAKRSLVNTLGQQPGKVWIVKDGAEIQVLFESLQHGDIIAINAGEHIPVDGVIVKGISSVDQHILTGESRPAEQSKGDRVFASTIVISGSIHIKVEKTGEETVAAAIGKILDATAEFETPLSSQGQKIADRSVIPFMTFGLISYPLVGINGMFAVMLSDFCSVMRLVSPIGMLNYIRITSRKGILIKDGRSLEHLNRVDTVLFDKTGTLTTEKPNIEKIYTFNNAKEEKVLICAAAAEYRQNHPMALAILEEAEKRGIKPPEIDEACYKTGYGISVTMDRETILVGSHRFMDMEGIKIPESFDQVLKTGLDEGKTFVYAAADNKLIGAIKFAPAIRAEAPQVIENLKQRNISIYIISGDHEGPTKSIAQELGIENYFAEVLPDDKAKIVEQLQKKGKRVCFVGDGINDSIAMQKADVSVSVSGASTVAADAAHVVLMDQTLKKLPDLLDISHDFQNNVKDAFYAVCAPGFLGTGGVFFAGFSVLAMNILFSTSIAAGILVTMLPVLKTDKSESKE
jgi:Cu2+-exporting ATPase